MCREVISLNPFSNSATQLPAKPVATFSSQLMFTVASDRHPFGAGRTEL